MVVNVATAVLPPMLVATLMPLARVAPALLELPGRRRRSYFSCRAEGLCTASPSDLSLRTRYCGSSFDAFTVRRAASVSLVIFFSTEPSACPPWEFHVTLSPFENSCSPTFGLLFVDPPGHPGQR